MCFSVMSSYSLDDPGFETPSAPPSSDSSSVDAPSDVRRNCIACPGRMSKKTVDRHTLCISCRGSDCDLDNRCEECMDWPEEEIKLYAKYPKSLKSKTRSKSSVPPPPPATSVSSPQPSPRADLESRVDSLSVTVATLAELIHSKFDAITVSVGQPFLPQVSSQARLEPDVRDPHPGSTAGYHQESQGLGGPDRSPAGPSLAPQYVHQGIRAQFVEQLGSASAAQPSAAPGTAPQPSTAFTHWPPPTGFTVPPHSFQPSTSGWVPSGPPPPLRSTPESRSTSESEDSDAESAVSTLDSAASHLADLIYESCPESRPAADATHPPRCGFEAWFGQPPSSSSHQRFRLYPRVAEVESEVSARAEAIACRSKPLSQILPRRSRKYTVADDPLYTSSQPVNPSFAQLAGAKAVGFKRWGSISFSEMERLEWVFRNQLEVTSSSLWLMSGILAMLKRDGFQPSDPSLFNTALSSVSAAMSQQAHSAATGSTFLRSKCRDSLLSHTSVPVPEAQRKSLTVSPGSGAGLFDESLLSDIVAQVQRSSLISSRRFLALLGVRGHALLPPLRLLVLLVIALLVWTGRLGSALPPPRDPEEVSALGVARGRLLLPNLRVFGSRSHHLA